MDLKKFLPATDNSIQIEQRLFDITLFLTVSILLFWSIYAFIIGYGTIIKIVYSSSFIIYSGIYFAYKKEVSFNILATLYYCFSLLLIIVSWLPSGGIAGAIMSMFVILYISGLLVLPLKAFIIYVSTSILVVLVFAFIEINYADLAISYLDQHSAIIDLSLANFIMLSVIGFGLFIFKRTYISDRENLNEVIAELAIEKAKAEEADNAKTRFLASVSHEMRTPLNGIIGITDLLSNSNLTKDHSELLENLSSSGKILNSLISDILDLTLIEKEKLTLVEHKLFIEKELKSVVTILRPLLQEKKEKVLLNYSLDENIPTLMQGDSNRIRQVLINLVTNAIKFTNVGNIDVRAELLSEQPDSVRVRFSVRDTGIGIDTKHKEHLFDKFYQVPTGDKNSGTGLGLSLCKTIIELMQGEIGLESSPGIGSEFYFTIPLKKVEQPNSSTDGFVSMADRLGKLQILVAEDMMVNQIVITRMLKNAGVTHVDVANDGELAIAMATKKDYDFIFMDVRMPKVDGIEAAHKIMNMPDKTSKPIIIAVTANVIADDFDSCKEAGMKDFVSKPFTAEILKNTIIANLENEEEL